MKDLSEYLKDQLEYLKDRLEYLKGNFGGFVRVPESEKLVYLDRGKYLIPKNPIRRKGCSDYLGFLSNEEKDNAVYDFNGDHRGWIKDDYLFDIEGFKVCRIEKKDFPENEKPLVTYPFFTCDKPEFKKTKSKYNLISLYIE